MEKIEIRSIASLSVNEDTLSVEGLVNQTNTWSKILGTRKKFRERIVKGAFAEALKNAVKVDFLSEHNKSLLLSSTENGSLELYEDEEGLQMRAMVAPTSYGKDVHTLIKSKMMNHMSFGFKVLKESWSRGLDGIAERTIEQLSLTEVSAVRNPCYSQSVIEARGFEVVNELEIPELEDVKEEERAMEMTMDELKASLKAEILAEMEAQRACKEEDRASDVENKIIEAEIKEEILEEKLDAQEDKLELEAKKEILEDRAGETPEVVVEETPAVEVEETVVKVSEKVEVSTKTEMPDGSVQEVSEELETSTKVKDEKVKEDVIAYIKALKENATKRL